MRSDGFNHNFKAFLLPTSFLFTNNDVFLAPDQNLIIDNTVHEF